uniref:Uncharacterized protein n=1 Tax=Panagrolaimus sp. ES5 TaxID=591445 RepID=A0AC34F7H8_9BILA
MKDAATGIYLLKFEYNALLPSAKWVVENDILKKMNVTVQGQMNPNDIMVIDPYKSTGSFCATELCNASNALKLPTVTITCDGTAVKILKHEYATREYQKLSFGDSINVDESNAYYDLIKEAFDNNYETVN